MMANAISLQRQKVLHAALADWVASCPGSFSDRNMTRALEKAYASFAEFSKGTEGGLDHFEESLKSECGYWMGACGVRGSYLWLLVLPSKGRTA
jgi:hypothetical protein